MTKNQRKILEQLLYFSNRLGHTLDYTAVSRELLIDRQQSLMLVYKALYGFFGDHKDNPYREMGLASAEDALNDLLRLEAKIYTDSNGNLFDEGERMLMAEQSKGIYNVNLIKLKF